MLLVDNLLEPLSVLPPVEYAFSYGSGVFPQPDNTRRTMLEKPMVDYILGVACPTEWHSKVRFAEFLEIVPVQNVIKVECKDHQTESSLLVLFQRELNLFFRSTSHGQAMTFVAPGHGKNLWTNKARTLATPMSGQENIEKNPHHYSSWLAKFGGKWVSGVADKVGVGVHFNPFVPWKDKTIKYGVIAMEHLKRDILTWNSLYISGRLQKPVCVLVDTAEFEKLNEANLTSALFTAMLLGPPEFTEEELYMMICGLSYLGDVRMLFAEDKNKVQKIVRGSSDRFRLLYSDVIHKAASSGLLALPTSFNTHSKSKLMQSGDLSSVHTMLCALPSTILQRLGSKTGVAFEGHQSGRAAVAEAVLQAREGHAKLLRRAICGVVRSSSIRQMVSGFFAAGGANAVQYVARKASKAWQSRQ